MDDDRTLGERLVRIETKLEAIDLSIRHGDASSAQLVQLVAAKVENIEDDVTAVGNLARSVEERVNALERALARAAGWRAGVLVALGASSGLLAGLLLHTVGAG